MREVFNEAVKDGDTYEVMYADMSTSKFERGFVFDCNTTTFFITSSDSGKAILA